MSKTIEERIVEMKFDNKQFESGVKETRKTIEQLNKDLEFRNASQGIQNVQNAFNSLDLSVMLKGFENFKTQLSGIEIFTKRIIENLADSLYSGIQKLNSGLTSVFRQISEGGARRAQNIEQAKFQLEGLGVAWEDIKGDIDYAVSGTAYGLDAAARAASQLVASNIQLGDEMKSSLRGISGLAAMTNSSYEDIASIFTKVAGQGRLMGDDLNRIAVRGINAAAELAKVFNVTEEEIRDMVSKGQIDFKTFAKAMDDAFGEHAKDANKTYSGSLSNVNAALSRLGADIKTAHFETLRKVFVDLIPQLNALKKAFKPVEDMIIKVEESIGALIQKIINMIDVKKIVEKIAPLATKIGNKIVDAIDVVTLALDKMNEMVEDSPLAKMVRNMKADVDNVQKYGKAFSYVSREMAMMGSGFGDAIKYSGDEIKAVDEEVLKMSEDMSNALQAAKDIWYEGKYGNGQQRIDALTAAGIDSKKTQAIIDEFIQNGGDWDAAVKKVGEDTGETIESNNEKAEKFSKTVTTLAKIFNNIKRTFKAVATSISNVVSALFKSITGTMEDVGLGDILVKITGKIADLAEKFMITKEMAVKLTKPVKAIFTILKKAIKIIATVIKSVAKLITNVVKLIYNLGKMIYDSKTIRSFINNLVSGFKKLASNVSDFIKSIRESERLRKFIEILKEIGTIIFGTIVTAVNKIVDFISPVITAIKHFTGTVADFFIGMFDGFKSVGGNVVDFLKYVVDKIKASKVVEELKESFKYFYDPTNAANLGDNIFVQMYEFIGRTMKWIIYRLKQLDTSDLFSVFKDTVSIITIWHMNKLVRDAIDFFHEMDDFLDGVGKLLSSTARLNKSMARLNDAKAFATIAKTILTFSISIGIITMSIIAVSDYISKSDKAWVAFNHSFRLITELMKVMFIGTALVMIGVKAFDLAISAWVSKAKIHIPLLIQLAGFIYSIGYTLDIVLRSMMTLLDLKPEEFQQAGERLITIAGFISAFLLDIYFLIAAIDNFVGSTANASKGMFAMAAIVLSVAISIDALMVAMTWMASLVKIFGSDVMWKSVEMIGVSILALSAGMALMMLGISSMLKNAPEKSVASTLLSMAGLVIAISLAMLAIMLAINDMVILMKFAPDEWAIAWAATWFFIETLLVTISYLVEKVSIITKFGYRGLKQCVHIVVLLAALLMEVMIMSQMLDTDYELAAAGMALLGLVGIVDAMAVLMDKLGNTNPNKAPSIAALALAFGSLAFILMPLKDFKDFKPADVVAIAAAMAGLTTIVALLGQTIKYLKGRNKPDPAAIKNLAYVFMSLATILVPLIAFTQFDDWYDVGAVGAAMVGLIGIVALIGQSLRFLGGKDQPKPEAIKALADVFISLAAILAPLIFFKKFDDGYDVGAVAVAMAGLIGIVSLIGQSLRFLRGKDQPKPETIKALADVFKSLALILVPLILFKEFNDGYDVGSVAVAMAGLIGIVALIGQSLRFLGGKDQPKPAAIKNLAYVFASLAAILVPLIFFTQFDSGYDLGAIAIAMAGLILIVSLIGQSLKTLSGVNKPKAESIKALALVFSSLMLILIPIMAYDFNDGWDALGIAAAMGGLTAIVIAMSKLISVIDKSKMKPKTIAALGAAFLGLATLIVPFIWIKGEDWPAIFAGMGGLTLVVAAFAGVLDALSSTATPGKIIAIGGGIALMTSSMALLIGVLGYASQKANIDNVIALAFAVETLMAVLGIVGAVLGKIPQAEIGIIVIVAAIIGLTAAIWLLVAAMNTVMTALPAWGQNLREFAYVIGEIPRIIERSLNGETREALGINSPSTVFKEIGDYCMQGLFLGIKEGLVSGVKSLINWLKSYIIEPICKFFKIASPSRVLETIGEFVGEGFLNGINNILENGIDFDTFTDFIQKCMLQGPALATVGTVLGAGLGDGLTEGLKDSLSLDGLGDILNVDSLKDSLNLDNFSIDNLIDMDDVGNFDLSSYSSAISEATGASVEEGFRGVDFSKIYTWEEVANSEELQQMIRDASQGAFVDAALEISRHQNFMDKYPTFADFMADVENIAGPYIAEKYRNGTDEMRAIIEQGLIQNYTDLIQLSDDAFSYINSGLTETAKEAEETLRKIKGPRTLEQDLSYRIVNGNGQYVGNTIGEAIGLDGNPLTCHVEGSAIRENINAVATSVSSAIDSIAKTLGPKLDKVDDGLSMLEQSIRDGDNDVVSGLDKVYASMNNTQIVLDSGALVGQLVGPMDNEIGKRARMKARR